MFNNPDLKYKYAPILSIRPAEMTAIEELPDKAKNIMLPIIPIKGWVGSKKLNNSIERIHKAIGQRHWIADIDSSFIGPDKKKSSDGKYPRDVFYEVEDLLSPDDGYSNWHQYLNTEELSKAIPTIQLQDKNQLGRQIERLSSLNRGLVARFTIDDINSGMHIETLTKLAEMRITDALIIFDYGQVSNEILTFASAISTMMKNAHRVLPNALICLSCSSFPSSFSNYSHGTNSIYERRLYNIISSECSDIRMIYSDRGGARAESIGGGGGIPNPRIDYPYANEWFFILKKFNDNKNPQAGEKEALYEKIAQEIMSSPYWQPNLNVWGTQIIELTCKREKYGINSPMRATAVRLNIHMHQQLYYDDPDELMDTDEEWTD